MTTACALPPELTELQLHLFLDSDASVDVASHLSNCAYCRERVDRLQSLQNTLKRELFRIACPTPEELGAFGLQLLDEGRAADLKAHIATCPYCLLEVAEFDRTNLVASDVTKPGVTDVGRVVGQVRVKLAEWVASWGTGQGKVTPIPAFASVRGSSHQPLLFRTSDGIEVSIEILDDSATQRTPDESQLIGLVTGIDTAPGSKAILLHDGAIWAESFIDDLGNFGIVAPNVGDYDLILQFGDLEIHIPTITIRNSSIKLL